jgi:hypothetical protein
MRAWHNFIVVAGCGVWRDVEDPALRHMRILVRQDDLDVRNPVHVDLTDIHLARLERTEVT